MTLAYQQTYYMIVQTLAMVKVEDAKSRADKADTRFLKKLRNTTRAVNTECGTEMTKLACSFTHLALVCLCIIWHGY
jgi:hypothetical protein